MAVMTKKQRAFAKAYLELGDSEAARKKAGYQKLSGESILKKPQIIAYLKENRRADRVEAIGLEETAIWDDIE